MVVSIPSSGFSALHSKKLSTAHVPGFVLALFIPSPDGQEKVHAGLPSNVSPGDLPDLTLHGPFKVLKLGVAELSSE